MTRMSTVRHATRRISAGPTTCALVRTDAGVAIATRATPTTGAGTALVRLIRGAVTQTDAASATGTFRGVLGHQCVGIVERVGDGVGEDARWVGRRVVCNHVVPCHTCDRCRRGLSHHCATRTIAGMHGRDGVFSQWFAAPISTLTEVPAGVDDDSAAFALPVAQAAHLARIARFEGKPYISVLGDSVEALLMAQVLSKLNASVRLLGSVPKRFSLCERWGIKHRAMNEAGLRQDQDIVVDTTGDTDSLRRAAGLVRPRGTILLAWGTLPAERPAPASLLADAAARELTIAGGSMGSLAEGLNMIAQGTVELAALVQRKFRIEQADEALQLAATPDSLRVLIDAERAAA